MRIYVAGPMTGLPHFNFPAFDAAAAQLRRLGHEVCNPAEHDRDVHGNAIEASETGDPADAKAVGFSLRSALAYDLTWIAENADAVAVLPGWEGSKGTRAEVALAHALGLIVLPAAQFVHQRHDGRTPVAGQITPAQVDWANVQGTGEIRTVSTTGGEKGVKPARFDLIPAGPLWAVAELYGKGADKYAARNWERGYEWSKSFGAMQRHAWLFWQGHDIDDGEGGTGLPHMACAVFHALALLEFAGTHPEFDDRTKVAS